jgi:FlaA1/EpsC-like NDP-sugar epimerase
MLLSIKRTPGKLLLDGIVVAAAWLLAFELRFEGAVPGHYLDLLFKYIVIAVGVKLTVFALLGSYTAVWRYTSIRDLAILIRGVVISFVVLGFIVYLTRGDVNFSRKVLIIDAMLTLILCGAIRLLPRMLREALQPGAAAYLPERLRKLLRATQGGLGKPTLVVGSGDAGEAVVRLLNTGEIRGYRAVGLVDDDPKKQGLRIHGVSVLGATRNIPELVRELDCKVVLLAIPSAPQETIRRIANLCRAVQVQVRILPDLKSIVSGERSLAEIQELDVEALLGREKVDLDIEGAASYVAGRRILITGAGGSIGSELCRQLLRFGPSEIILFGRGENSIHSIYHELYRTGTQAVLHQVIGDVINKKKLAGTFTRFRPDIVFHAGADKHVPLMELNPDEAVLNNILGTRNVLELSNDYEVERVVCISTDKAVNPTSVMGCCKRVAEMIVQSGNYTKTKAVAVRFGNVLGSRGSVIPLFEEQIRQGGPVTVTDRNVVRFFMTIPEAVQLVIQAGAMGEGGEIFILEMGDPVRIEDLARNVIRMYGYEPEVEIPIKITGLRPGEKLSEELVIRGEKVSRTRHPKIMRVDASARQLTDGELRGAVEELTRLAVGMEDARIRERLRSLVPEFHPYPSPEVTSVEIKND